MTASAYIAAHEGVAFRRRRDRALLEATGGDRLTWLQGLVTNDVSVIEGGGASEAAWLTPQGRMVTDLSVVETGPFTWLDVPAPLAAALAQKLDLLIFTEDVHVRVDEASTSVGVYGPEAAGTLRDALGTRLAPAAGPETVVRTGALIAAADSPLVLTADAVLGVPGFRVYLPLSRAAWLEEALARGGAARLDDDAEKTLRVEAGVPRFMVDMNEETIPLEAGLDAVLSQTKGCYVGQEIIVRIRDRAHGRVARRLVRLVFPTGAATPAEGQGVFFQDRPAGRLTSAVLSPVFGRAIGLATLHRDAAEAGAVVVLEDGSRAEVAPLPIQV